MSVAGWLFNLVYKSSGMPNRASPDNAGTGVGTSSPPLGSAPGGDSGRPSISERMQAVTEETKPPEKFADLPNKEGPDQIIGRSFKVLAKLGSGATSSVLKAVDMNLDRQVAIKVLFEDSTEDGEITRIFLQEGKTLAQIDHPNVVKIYASEVDEKLKFPVLIMELVEGTNFDGYQEKFREDPKILLKFLLEILTGIEACHKKGIVHRDLKPANILITPEGKIKIIDFGIARPPNKDLLGNYILGTPEYMSPEQFSGGKVTSKADIYAIAIIFWEMLSGKLPFFTTDECSDCLTELAQKHLNSAPPMDALLKVPHAAPFAGIIESMLSKDPEKRPGISDFIEILKAELEKPNPSSPAGVPRKIEPAVKADQTREDKLAEIRKYIAEGVSSKISDLEARLISETDSVVISAILFGIAALGGVARLQVILPFLKNPDPLIRSNAVLALTKIDNQATWIHFVGALGDPEARVRNHASSALKNLGLERVKEYLQTKIFFGSSGERVQATLAMRFFPNAENLVIIRRLLKDESSELKSAAQKTMDHFRKHPALIPVLSDASFTDIPDLPNDLKNHVIVCGLDQKSLSLLKNLKDIQRVAVLIDKDEKNPLMEKFLKFGFPLIKGSPADPSVLFSAKVNDASHIFAFTENDDTNLETALKARMLVSNARRPETQPPLHCFIHLSQPHRRQLFYRTEGLSGNSSFEPRIFNIFDNSARQILHMFPPDSKLLKAQIAGKPLHVLIVGFGDLGMSVTSQACRLFQGTTGGGLNFTIVDSEIGRREDLFRFRYPKMEEVAEWRFIEGKSPFKDKNVWKAVSGEVPVCLIYVCHEDPARARDVASEARSNLSGVADAPRIVGFPSIETVCRFERIVEEGLDEMAMALHRFYCESGGTKEKRPAKASPSGRFAGTPPSLDGSPVSPEKSGMDSSKNARLAGWLNLRGDLKESNRTQADHIAIKLMAIGAKIVSSAETPDSISFSEDEIDLLARMEHRRWLVDKILDGWKYAPEYDFMRQFHPALTSWEKLTEEDRKKNVGSIVRMPEVLAVSGNKAVRQA